jgi:ATP-dependent DNA helicase RecG
MRTAIDEGQKIYWICPLVEETEESELMSVEERHATLASVFGEAAGLVHGRMSGPEKDAAMLAFKNGETRLLVATTVVEVGVDVPDASIMVIEHAERFGLAQLHQLRGRVGRGEGKSTCLLIRGQNLTEVGRARLALMRETNDGFRIAEEDLRLRGPGEILGTRQSGEEAFRVATPQDVDELAPIAQSDALLLLDRDGGLDGPRGQAARICLYLFERDQAVGLIRSG